MKKFIFITSLIILFFSFSKVSFAYTLYSQLDNNTQTNNTTYYKNQSLGPNLSGEWTSIQMYAQSSKTDKIGLYIQDCNSTSTCSVPTQVGCSFSSSSPVLQDIGTTMTLMTFTLYSCPNAVLTDNPFTITNNNIYRILPQLESTTSTLKSLGSNSSTSYQNDPLAECITDCGSVKDLYFRINASGTIPSAISITYPTNGTSTADFNTWAVSASGEIAKVKINYEDNFSNYSDTATVYSTTNGYITIPIPKSHALAISTSSFYSATPYILDINDNIIASGTTIYFQINQGFSSSTSNTNWQNFLNTLVDNGIFGVNTYSNIGWNLPEPTASTTAECFWNSSPIDCIINGFYKLAANLFTPHDISLNTIKSQLTQFSTIFPFSVPLTLMQQLETSASTTPTYSALAITLPDLNNTTFTLLSSSSVSSTIGSSAASTYFSVWRTILYTLTGGIMFFTIF